MNSNTVFTEITPLLEEDSLYIIDRAKEHFTFPLHKHDSYEINFLENASGAQRIVGDSVEVIDDLELVLIAGENLEHCWEDHNCTSDNIREVTIQFSRELINEGLLGKKQFYSIKKLLHDASRGIVFDLHTTIRVRSIINALTVEKRGFYSVITFMSLLYELSMSHEYRVLSSTSFAMQPSSAKSRRIRKIEKFILENINRPITANEAAELINMATSSFSRFFKQHTAKNFTEYVADLRIGYISRMLLDSEKTIAEICYDSGFNNISNFNRTFKSKKGCSPREFREIYKKNKTLM